MSAGPQVVVRRASIPVPGCSIDEIVQQVASELAPSTAAAVILFVPASLDRAAFATAIHERCGETTVIGCTTAGGIDSHGLVDEVLVGVSLPREHFRVSTACACDLRSFTIGEATRLVEDLVVRHESQPGRIAGRMFGMLLIDGLSRREEIVTSALHAALPGIPLFGGSAGDDQRFASTAVLADGRFVPNTAVLALIQTDLPFHVFRSQHLEATDHFFVVTSANSEERLVLELDGEPADRVYARAIGVEVADLTPEVFAEHPVVVRLAGQHYVRSIQQRNADGSLTFYCAIDEGLILHLATASDLVGSLERSLKRVSEHVGPPQLVIGCDCILRKLEAERHELHVPLANLFARYSVMGFHTYGEQYGSIHVNQTFTGVAIGAPGERAA